MSNPPKDGSQTPSDFIVLATIVRPHGLKGEVKVSLSCPGLDRLVSCPSLRLVKDGKEIKKVSVRRSFMHQDGDAVVRLREVEGIDEAESLRGAYLAVVPEDRPKLPEGNFYVDDLEGLTVTTVSGEDLGKVEEVLAYPANAVCVVRKPGLETLVPVLKTVVREVDLEGRRMVVELSEEVDAEKETTD